MKDPNMMTMKEKEVLSQKREMEHILYQERQIEVQRLMKVLADSVASGKYEVTSFTLMEGTTNSYGPPTKEFRLVLQQRI